MKTEASQASRRLLNDVLLGDPVGTEPERARHAALAAFRQTRLLRRIRNYVGVSLMIGATGALTFYYGRTERPATTIVKQSVPHPDAVAVNSASLPRLTDEELVASFPPNTCFLAEVDGRQILVFTEPQLKARFLHEP